MSRHLMINLPFIEALQRTSKYAKILKDFLKRKESLEELLTVPLNGECYAVVLNKLSENYPISAFSLFQALANLGASINIILYSLYEKLGLEELIPTRMSLSLADHSVKYPRGIIENFFVKVDNLVFPIDFVVLDMKANERVPIILGHPFLRTARALVDDFEGNITLRAGNNSVTNVAKSMRHSSSQDGFIDPCHPIYSIDSIIPSIDPRLDHFHSV
ncbi:uncharacterized protein LOC143553413 [Bidens hawaiensis]|uniref:uncharacterized protein LOC143553413 n=1 Tax=Bidens hawaiensis TaxID=980011 RepID=UPI00404B9EAB